MNPETKELEAKRKDYKRFITTLLIISVYLYMGAIMDTYIRPTGVGGILIGLSFGMLAAVAWFIVKYRKIKGKIEENERV